MSSTLTALDFEFHANHRTQPSSITQLKVGCQVDCPAFNCRRPTLGSTRNSVSSQETLVELTQSTRAERRMGDTELSYYLPARESGVNDMYLHLGCHAPRHILKRERVRLVWAILRIRHPLLASKIEMYSYDDVRFAYVPPHSAENALDDAGNNLEYRAQTKDGMIETVKCEFLISAAHFLGDGIALHQFANDFFGLLGSSSTSQLSALLFSEWYAVCGKLDDQPRDLPSALESRLPALRSKFAEIVARVDFDREKRKLIGGQTFPRMAGSTRRTVVPTVSFDENRTRDILKRCKDHGVSISSALFAICNIAWAKTRSEKPEIPTYEFYQSKSTANTYAAHRLMYSALNLRPCLLGDKAPSDSYWFLSIGYFNVVLPTFLPRSGELGPIFWHRARSAKSQSTNIVKNPLTVSRSREMARERGRRAKAWAKEDDDKANGVWKAPPPAPRNPGPPSSALLGLSLLGNLDGIYKHSNFPEIKLDTLTTGSRQRAGGMLLFGYTFVGKLWISLGYDENGLDKEVVEGFWSNVLSCTDEFLID
ncbi:hypothetical protein C0995_012963 [Termitomyces sp. Mi166|nr:hypothetical protein C0995_012963 [Termitomyces sp. Mi166\